MPRRKNWCATVALSLFAVAAGRDSAFADATGGFAVVLDKAQNQAGDSKRSLVFYDVHDMAKPLFGVFLGTEAMSGSSASAFEDPESITVNPRTGDVYVLAFDSGTPSILQLTQVEPDGDIDGRGDYDLLRVDFQAAYADWEANHQATSTYVTYGDGTSEFDPSHANPQAAPSVVTKIGEIGRSPGNDVAFSFVSHLEFISPTQLAYIDANTADMFGNPNVGGEYDVQIRLIDKVTGPAVATDGGTLGGFNNNTAEAWESSRVGYVNLDASSASSVVSIAAVRNRDGVTGLWILENDDGSGDEVAFFDFAAAAYRPINTFGTLDRFQLDNNPSLNPDENLGNGDKVLVDPRTGDLVVVESGHFDGHQPTVYKLEINSYDDAGAIAPAGFTSNQQINLATVYNDGTTAIDGRNSFYDWVTNAVYFLDEDNSADTLSDGVPFAHDWYRLDLTTGETTAVGPDADLNGLFSAAGLTDDLVEFFSIRPAGDYNDDGTIDSADYAVWQSQFGATGPLPAFGQNADGNGDGVVDAGDYAVWRDRVVSLQQLAMTAADARTAVPEPALLGWLMILGIVASHARCRRSGAGSRRINCGPRACL
ncbi:MAG: dockerin type I domain-containing protein [Pirellulales bacterium]